MATGITSETDDHITPATDRAPASSSSCGSTPLRVATVHRQRSSDDTMAGLRSYIGRGVDFLPNSVGSTPIPPFPPPFPPPASIPLSFRPNAPAFTHSPNPAQRSGERWKLSQRGLGQRVWYGAPAANAVACILGWEIAAGGDDFQSWWRWVSWLRMR